MIVMIKMVISVIMITMTLMTVIMLDRSWWSQNGSFCFAAVFLLLL